VEHRGVVNFLISMREIIRLEATDRLLAVTTLAFDIAGLELYLPLMVGARVVMASSEALHNPRMLARLIRRSAATHVQATPSLWRVLLSSSETRLHHVHALVGGEVLSAELAARLKSMAARVTQFYGPTETTVWSAFHHFRSAEEPIVVGRPLANTQIYILDKNLQPVPTGVPGEIHIGGEGVAAGYLNRPDLTSEKFISDPFSKRPGATLYKTGDLGRFLPDGRIEFRGRADHQVPGVVVEIVAADVVLALGRDGVGGPADLGDQLARVARPRAEQARLDQRRVDLQPGLGGLDGIVDEERHLVGPVAQRRHRDQLAAQR